MFEARRLRNATFHWRLRSMDQLPWRCQPSNLRPIPCSPAWSLIDVATMANSDDNDQQYSAVDGVNDSVVTNPEAKALTSSQRSRGGRARVLGEKSDSPLNSRLRRSINLAELPKSRWAKLNSVRAHNQPRSVFTCSHGMLSPSSMSAASNAATSCDSSRASSISSY